MGYQPAVEYTNDTPSSDAKHWTWLKPSNELIEASHLFAMPEDKIEIVVHPQSVIHSLVDYADGSVLAQLGVPDMRVPIAYTLAWPERMETPCAALDLAKIARLDFQPPDAERSNWPTKARFSSTRSPT